MNITEIRMDRTKSLGNYENLKLGFTAVLEEGETEADAIDRLRMLLDWEINYTDRAERYRKLTKWIQQLDQVPEKSAKEVEQRNTCSAEIATLDRLKEQVRTAWPSRLE